MLLFARASLRIRVDWVVASLRRLLWHFVEVVDGLAMARCALVLIVFVVVFPLRHAAVPERVVELPPLMVPEVIGQLRNETGSGVRRHSDVRRIEMHYYRW